MKVNTNDDAFWTRLRDEVFGPCTVVGECYSIPELKEDFHSAAMSFRQWFNIRLEVEEYDIFPELPGMERTDAEIEHTKRRVRQQLRGIRKRMKEYLAK